MRKKSSFFKQNEKKNNTHIQCLPSFFGPMWNCIIEIQCTQAIYHTLWSFCSHNVFSFVCVSIRFKKKYEEHEKRTKVCVTVSMADIVFTMANRFPFEIGRIEKCKQLAKVRVDFYGWHLSIHTKEEEEKKISRQWQ